MTEESETEAPRLSPRAIIRASIRAGLKKTLVADWARPSRKYGGMVPGIKRYTGGPPEIWVLIDTSGSIDAESLSSFLGTVWEFAREASKVNVVCWGDAAYDVIDAKRIDAKSREDVLDAVAKKIKGGGGTRVKAALEKTREKMRAGDIVLLLTDGTIGDWGSPETRDLLTRVAYKAGAAVVGTTDKTLSARGWRTISLKGV